METFKRVSTNLFHALRYLERFVVAEIFYKGFSIVGAGDFNGDGTDDVLLKSGNYYGAWLVNNGNAAGWMGLGDLGNVTVEQIADFNGDGKDDLRIRTSAGDLGTQLVMGEDDLVWKYYGSVGSEWSTALAALA